MLREELLRRFPLLERLPRGSYVVGGAVRDLLSGHEPSDVDVACLDPRLCAEAISDRVIRLGTGEHLSAWRVVKGGQTYDFAEILDHDVSVDLARRDFTVNAIAVVLETGELFDPHGGRDDLKARTIRMIEPSNFDDDPLRCLKGVRMAVKHQCELQPATIEAIRQRAERIVEIAAERITFELEIIFSSRRFRTALELLRETGLDVPLFGAPIDASRFHSDDVGLAGAYALLIRDPRAYARRWRWSAELLHDVVMMQRLIGKHATIDLFDAGERIARQLPPVLRALGQSEELSWPDFDTRVLLTGEEIALQTGIGEGPGLGRIKRALLEAQIGGGVTRREEADRFVASAARALQIEERTAGE